jgi:hypothetical protein
MNYVVITFLSTVNKHKTRGVSNFAKNAFRIGAHLPNLKFDIVTCP